MLAKALDSVERQGRPDVEHIVVDGGSTDGTRELVAGKPGLRLIEGRDRGVYDALNKGIAAATGDIVGFLNSDDYYEPDAFAAAAEAFARAPEADSVCGDAQLVSDGAVIATFDRDKDKRLTSARTALLGNCTINARFFKRDVLARIGPFSLDYPVVADRDFLARAVTMGVRTNPTSAMIYTYRQHGGSLSFSGEAAQRLPIWRELLALARVWSRSEAASSSTRRTARALEGRCLGRFIQQELAEGRIGGAWRLLSQGEQRLPVALKLLAEGAIDAAAIRIAVHTSLR